MQEGVTNYALCCPLREKVENDKKYGTFHKRGYKIALKPFEQCPRMRKSRFPIWEFDSFEIDKAAKSCPEASEVRGYLLCAGTKPQKREERKISEEDRGESRINPDKPEQPADCV